MKICKLETCDRPHKAKGYCDTHYCRTKRRGYIGDPDILDRHGMTKCPEYHIWVAMKGRCFNVNDKRYSSYGGRGITICCGWKNNYITFINDIGSRPFKNYSIDRIDNDGNYSCGHCEECIENGWEANCRWTDATTQRYNQRPKYNKTGYAGVVKINKKYRARVTNQYKNRVDLGLFNTSKEAYEAILEYNKSNNT